MTRKKIEKLQKEYSKPQYTKWEKQKRTQFWTLIIGVVVIIVVIALVGTGFYLNSYRPAHETMLEVNGTKFTTSDYAKLLHALSIENPKYINTYSSYVIPYLEQTEEMKQAAEKLGVTATDAEVKDYMTQQKKTSGYEPIARAQVILQKLQKDYFAKQVDQTAEQRDVAAMLLESPSQAKAVKSELTDSNFSDLAVANSVDSYTKDKNGEIGEHPRAIFTQLFSGSSTVGDIAFSLGNGDVSSPVTDNSVQKNTGYWLIMPIEKGTGSANEGKVNFRAMLLGSEEEALQIKSIIDGISDPAAKADKFREIATAKSEARNATNGLLGMTAKGTMGDAFDAVAFNLNIGELSNPVKDTTQTTTGGYWLVKVNNVETDKALSSDDTDSLSQAKLSDWFTQVQADFKDKVKDLSNDKNVAWAIAKAKEGLSS